MKPAGVRLPVIVAAWLAALALSQAQAPPAKLVTTIEAGDDLAVLAAWSPDGGRLAYATEKRVRERRAPSLEDREIYTYPGEVWVSDFTAKPRRIFRSEQFRDWVGNVPSYYITRMAWSPDGQKLAIEVTTEERESFTFLVTAEGSRVKMESSGSNVFSGYSTGWLGDSSSLGVLTEAVSPRLLHRVRLVRTGAGRELSLFRDTTFAAVAWLPRAQKAVLVEQDPEFANPPRLELGDLVKGTLATIGELDQGYLGGLQAAPDEARVSYFIGQQKLAVRELKPAANIESWPIPLGRYEWASSAALVYLEPQEKGRRTGWLTLYDRRRDIKLRVLPEVLIQNFWLAPEGRRVAVLTAGLDPKLQVYELALGAPAP